jgi:hypothetical protein
VELLSTVHAEQWRTKRMKKKKEEEEEEGEVDLRYYCHWRCCWRW